MCNKNSLYNLFDRAEQMGQTMVVVSQDCCSGCNSFEYCDDCYNGRIDMTYVVKGTKTPVQSVDCHWFSASAAFSDMFWCSRHESLCVEVPKKFMEMIESCTKSDLVPEERFESIALSYARCMDLGFCEPVPKNQLSLF